MSRGTSTGRGMMHGALLADLIGYHEGRVGHGYTPAEWDESVRLWIHTPRGTEALSRMTHTRRSDHGYVIEGPAIFGEEPDTDRAGGRG